MAEEQQEELHGVALLVEEIRSLVKEQIQKELESLDKRIDARIEAAFRRQAASIRHTTGGRHMEYKER